MAQFLSDEDVGSQIIEIFSRNKVLPNGTLRRIHFFDVRDGDFKRGIDWAVFHNWIMRHPSDRYRYILTEAGYAAAKRVGASSPTAPA